ncbi:hypothetical protein D0C36_24300 [Mucilaginibacter conchicola]|uniref:Uncharacterized protein n=1 Tax=Mucilaginibacter conchicola TaxID=2303333 RepID=A0A372NMQ0_9SPHI|nr:hypothetical protein [Mucilaginibacter conchicola]RFZ89877.1 hypothetical protein D0C36_24300 [Mucilaginibacter conchicola]
MRVESKPWYYNEWSVAIGSGLVLWVFTSIADIAKGLPVFTTIVNLWNIDIKLGWSVSAILVFALAASLIKHLRKGQHVALFEEGTQVILKTDRRPVMVVGRFNPKNNTVLCSWTVDSKINEESINQNLLKLYENTEYVPRVRKESRFWL